AISASILAISATTLAMQDDDKQVLVNAAEDAAAYFENGKMSGTLAALVQLARENAAKMDSEAAAKLSEAQLVDGILSAAEQALDHK
ncbi:hypothetical protein EBZ37_11325, partial [bacterium]|nr:hypothetical protein [bacterium]